MARLKYLGGMAVGKPGQLVELKIEEEVMCVGHSALFGTWGYEVPVACIDDVTVDFMDSHVTAGRVLLTGILAFAMKKKEYVLAIDYDNKGRLEHALFGGEHRDLEKARQQIVAAIDVLPQPPPSAPRPSRRRRQRAQDTSVTAQLEKLAELRDKGIVSDAEFAAKKADLLARL